MSKKINVNDHKEIIKCEVHNIEWKRMHFVLIFFLCIYFGFALGMFFHEVMLHGYIGRIIVPSNLWTHVLIKLSASHGSNIG